jgi:hypothetical protein
VSQPRLAAPVPAAPSDAASGEAQAARGGDVDDTQDRHPRLDESDVDRVPGILLVHDAVELLPGVEVIVPVEVPQPSARNTSSGPNLAAEYHYAAGILLSSAGHLRVTAQYVRAWLPSSETAQRKNGQVDDTWSIGPP